MLSRLSSHEITEWIAYASREPIGQAREDLRSAMLCSLIANGNRDPKRRPQPFTPGEFVVDFWKDPEPAQAKPSTWKANLAKAEMITIALGGVDKRMVQ